MDGKKKEWALVTGASGGLGAEFARNLAARGYDLVLAARGEEAMKKLAEELGGKHGVQTVVESLDLGAPDAAADLLRRLDARGIDPSVLVNNAGFGLSGEFLENEPERLRAMLQLDVIAVTELAQLFGKRMAARGAGRILFIASLTAYGPSPLLAAYAAAKAYVLSLGEALHAELAPKVSVTVLSPGLMDTGFNAASGYETPASLKRTVLPPAKVAAIGLDALFAGRATVVAGGLNRLTALFLRLVPRQFQARMNLKMARSNPPKG